MTRMMTSGPYKIPRAECASYSVVTNSTPTTAYRGAGRPEATAAIERIRTCSRAKIDNGPPRSCAVANLIEKDDFPYTTPVDTVYRRR